MVDAAQQLGNSTSGRRGTGQASPPGASLSSRDLQPRILLLTPERHWLKLACPRAGRPGPVSASCTATSDPRPAARGLITSRRGGVFAPLLHYSPPSPTAHSSLSRVSDAPLNVIYLRLRFECLSNLIDRFPIQKVSKKI